MSDNTRLALTAALILAASPGILLLGLRWRDRLPVVVLVLLAVLPVVPDAIDPVTLSFLTLAALATVSHRGGFPGVALPFMTVVVLSAGWSPSVTAWARGAIPFLFWLTANAYMRLPYSRILTALIASGTLLSIRGLAAFVGTRTRITYSSLDFILPMPLIGIMACLVFLLYRPWTPRKGARPAVLTCLVLQIGHTLATATTGYVIALIAGVAVLVIPVVGNRRALARTMFVVAVVSVLAVALGPTLTAPFASRTSQGLVVSSISGREDEVRTALDEWSPALLQGRGLGHSFSSPINNYGEDVTYVHNIVAYLLMTLGLAGLTTYGYTMFILRARATGKGWLPTFIRAGLVTMLTLSLSSAVFRSVQFNCLVAVFVALARRAASDRRRLSRAPRKVAVASVFRGRTT